MAFLLLLMQFRRSAAVVPFDATRISIIAIGISVLALWIVARLFFLQIIRHDYYSLFALNSHEIYQRLHPTRGSIYFQDTRTKQEYLAAMNKEFYLVYAVPKDVPEGEMASTTAALVRLLGYDAGEQKSLSEKMAKRGTYLSIAKKVPEATMKAITGLGMKGVFASPQEYRIYPEEALAASVLGFTSFDDDGRMIGRYGVEGYWEKKLAGKTGFQIGEKGAKGSWIALADKTEVQPENGADLVLTIDRTLQFKACDRLRQGMEEYKAKSASLVMMNPKTGAVLAMCSLPDFDPNNYSKVDDVAAFNNTSVFTAYEPGSVFKSITMAAGLDLGFITPNTYHTDPCEMEINGHTVRNALRKCYGTHTMTQALENSVNTTLVWVQSLVGNQKFNDYVKKFGFGEKTGLTVNTEVAGDVSSLAKAGQIFGANGSFGQGLTVTPLQLATAYSAIANEGKLPKPYIVEEVRYPNGQKDKTQPQAEQVVSSRAAKLLSGMLISVVENHYRAAKIGSYYIAGKTGTAQIPEKGKYSETRTNHTFAGFAPADNARFVLIVKYEEPERQWAEQTTLPVFRDVMEFALNYYGIPAK